MIDPHHVPWNEEEMAEFNAKRELLNMRCHTAWQNAETLRVMNSVRRAGLEPAIPEES